MGRPATHSIIEFLAFHPKNHWLLAVGGAEKGILAFIDPSEKKVVLENEAPMHIHKVAFDEDHNTLFAAGHKRFVKFAATNKT